MTAWSKTVPGQNPQLSAPTIVLHRGQSFSKLFALGRLTKIGDFLSSSGNRISYLSHDSLNRRPMVDWTVCIGSVRPRERRSHDGESQNCASWHHGVAEEKRLADLRWRAHTNHVHRVLRRHHCDTTVSKPGVVGNNPFRFHCCRRFHGERPVPGERDVR
jgi:hypothetical protein